MIDPDETKKKAMQHAKNFLKDVGAEGPLDQSLALTSLISAVG